MPNTKFQTIQTRRGSALLVALLVMGILLTLTLGLSNLVIREIRQTRDIVASGKAYFAAEAGVEQALYDLSQSLPGYETATAEGAEDGWVVYSPTMPEDFLSYRYRIENKGDSFPYFADDEPVFLSPDVAVTKKYLYESLPEETYNVLPLNQTVTIPLFTDNGDGSFTNLSSFLIQYYVDFDVDADAPQFQGQKIHLENFDILRWKLFGNPKNSPTKTDAISDFYPAHSDDSAAYPVCIGSDISLFPSCIIPVAADIQEAEVEGAIVGTGVGNMVQQSWSKARECYIGDAGGQVTGGVAVGKGCQISAFIEDHERNYITLTNVVNPDIVGVSNPEIRNAKANIYYRIIAKKGPGEPELVREFADISSDGFANDGAVKQSITAKIRLSSFLPVFNFSLYRTDTESDLD